MMGRRREGTHHFTIRAVFTIRASARHGRAIAAAGELLGKQRLEHLFVGGVARAAWLGDPVDSGPVDVLALMQPQQKNNVAMMAANRGFRVDRDEIEATEELDLVPLAFADPEGDVRVHVLVASNALYARMFASSATARIGEMEIRIPSREDAALLLTLAEDADAVRMLAASPEFDRRAFNEKLTSIGLGKRVVGEGAEP
jgi:hypothetical protein